MGIKGETTEQRVLRKLEKKRRLVNVAAGREPADLVLKRAKYLNVFSNDFCMGDIAVCDGLIAGIGDYEGREEVCVEGKYVCPGLIDAHIHIESSLVKPAEFARAVVRHGTTTVVTDPHEITNVMGVDGIRYMIEASQGLPIDVQFMLPSCVPATPMDESGANLTYHSIDEFYEHPRVLGLAEMMNYTGVINADASVISQILASQSHHKKIDGHAPKLSGKPLNAYIAAGVYSDHECDTFENALEKLRLGQFIMIREGTAARNLQSLMPILTQQYADRVMFATDDKHPSDLINGGHIDYIVKQAIGGGVDPVLAIKAASHNAARYFLMNNKGAIAPGYLADMMVFDDFRSFNVLSVYKRGKLVFDGAGVRESAPVVSDELYKKALGSFKRARVTAADFMCGDMPAMGLMPHEIITTHEGVKSGVDVASDILKMAVLERHSGTGHIGMGYLKGYGLKSGAVATSIAHDSHNIICVGAQDADMACAVNEILDMRGGICVVDGASVLARLPLPVAGLMSEDTLENVNDMLEKAVSAAHSLGVSHDVDPFMTLSFLSLPVIPHIKLTTRGMFDVDSWKLMN